MATSMLVIETISRDLARRRELDYAFEDVDHEFQRFVAQMTEDELQEHASKRACSQASTGSRTTG